MTRPPSVLRSSLSLLSVRLVLAQIGLALLVFVLYVAWLRMPDASVLDVVGSAVLGLIVLAVAGAGESAIVLSLAGRARTPGRLLRGTLLLLASVALWLAWSALLDHMHGNDYLRAGYWNSRLPHRLRNFFSYEHILLWLGWFWGMLAWIGAGAIALPIFAATASARPLHAIVAATRSLAYWLAIVLCAIAATVGTGSLLRWTPGHGLRVELISLALRLGLAALIDAILVCFVLAILAACVRQSDALNSARYAAPGGTPDESQPRTVDTP
jgi:hypothetical protein